MTESNANIIYATLLQVLVQHGVDDLEQRMVIARVVLDRLSILGYGAS